MPRATITAGVVRNPTKLAKALNDLQLQVSKCRVEIGNVASHKGMAAIERRVSAIEEVIAEQSEIACDPTVEGAGDADES